MVGLSSSQRGDQLIHFIGQGLPVGGGRRVARDVGEESDGVRVRTGAADGGGDFAGRAEIALWALGAGVARVALRTVGDGEGAVGGAVAPFLTLSAIGV